MTKENAQSSTTPQAAEPQTTESQKAESPPKKKNIAIIAVHGVGNQIQNETARSIADLLLTPPGEAAGTDSPLAINCFEESRTRVPVERVKPPENQEDGEEPAEAFNRELLTGHQLKETDKTYTTIRLEGEGTSTVGQPTTRLHIYEMHWADLSKLAQSFVQIFSSMFLLIVHLGDIGRQTARFAWEQSNPDEKKRSRLWGFIFGSQRFSVGLIAGPILIMELYELAVTLLILPAGIPPMLQSSIAYFVLMLIVLWLLSSIAFKCSGRWAALLVVALGLGLAVLPVLVKPIIPKSVALRVLGIEYVFVMSVLLFFLIRKYLEVRRYDSKPTPIVRWDQVTRVAAIVIGLGTISGLLLCMLRNQSDPGGLYGAGFATVEALYAVKHTFWLVILFLVLIQGVIGLGITLKCGVRSKSARAIATVLLSIVGSILLFRIVTAILWAAILALLKGPLVTPELWPYEPWLLFQNANFYDPWRLLQGTGYSVDIFMDELLKVSKPSGFVWAVALVLAAFTLTAWALFPSIWAEIFHRESSRSTAEKEVKKTWRLGNWLSFGFSLLISGLAFICLFIAGPLLFIGYLAIAARMIEPVPLLFPALIIDPVANFLVLAGGAISTALIAFLTLRGPLAGVMTGFRVALGIVVDVDNYLREFPSDATPRARIFARYYSLLSYLCAWKDENEDRYDQIIIVAHSQGAVITADLLRYLNKHPDPAVQELFAKGKISFLTAGCPLRQLYAARFPHLYDWADHDEKKSQPGGEIHKQQKASAEELGVKCWLNLYRSGDYVGRHLWRNNQAPEVWNVHPSSRDSIGQRQEKCIGSGAHTHYFDNTAPDVRAAIVQLMQDEPALL